MASFILRIVSEMFLLFPISYCLHKTCDNMWIRLVLLISFAIGLSFFRLKGE